VVVLNYRNWGDTIECLESLMRLDYPCFEIIVCDNDSQDGSVDNILAWARGDVLPVVQHSGVAAARPSCMGPAVPHRLVPVEQVGLPRQQDEVRVFIVPTGRNGGFSAGNNVGIRFAMARADVGYVWLLNNDAVVAPDALSTMVARLEQDPDIGICGSRLLNYEQPCDVQALGGARYVRWRARARMLLPSDFPGLTGVQLRSAVEARMGYAIGASMLAPRRFIETVGELSESYFLYFEEVDWIRRAEGRFRLGYCPDSVVYHRLGASTGKASNSQLLWFHLSRSRVRFVARFDPWALPFVFALDTADALKAALRGRSFCARGIWRGLTDTGLKQLWALVRRRPERPALMAGG
jgi:GT2 family glycosyltransferase